MILAFLKRTIRHGLLAGCLMAWAAAVHAQAGGGLSVTANLKVEEGNFDMSSVLLENKTTSEKHTVAGSSRLTFSLKYNCRYILSFSKPGYITKKIEINTDAPDGRIAQGFYPIHFNVILMPQTEGVNIVVFNQPVSRWQFSKVMDDFFYDTDYTKSVQSAIQTAEEELTRKRAEDKEKAAQARKDADKARQDSIAQARVAARAAQDSLRTAEQAARAQAEEDRKTRAREEQAARAQAREAEAEEARRQAAAKAGEEERNAAQAAEGEEAARKAAALREAEEQRKQNAARTATEEESRRQARLKEVEEQREQLKAAMSSGIEHGNRNEMSDEVPARVSFEEIKEPNRTITRATVVKAGKSVVFSKIVYSWGGVYYFREDQSISETLYRMATQPK